MFAIFKTNLFMFVIFQTHHHKFWFISTFPCRDLNWYDFVTTSILQTDRQDKLLRGILAGNRDWGNLSKVNKDNHLAYYTIRIIKNLFTLGSVLDSQLSWETGKFQLARWSLRVALLAQAVVDPVGRRLGGQLATTLVPTKMFLFYFPPPPLFSPSFSFFLLRCDLFS